MLGVRRTIASTSFTSILVNSLLQTTIYRVVFSLAIIGCGRDASNGAKSDSDCPPLTVQISPNAESDLMNALKEVKVQEEMLDAGGVTYSNDLPKLSCATKQKVRITNADLGGWTATAVSRDSTWRCVLFEGDSVKYGLAPATISGRIACDSLRQR